MSETNTRASMFFGVIAAIWLGGAMVSFVGEQLRVKSDCISAVGLLKGLFTDCQDRRWNIYAESTYRTRAFLKHLVWPVNFLIEESHPQTHSLIPVAAPLQPSQSTIQLPERTLYYWTVDQLRLVTREKAGPAQSKHTLNDVANTQIDAALVAYANTFVRGVAASAENVAGDLPEQARQSLIISVATPVIQCVANLKPEEIHQAIVSDDSINGSRSVPEAVVAWVDARCSE